MEFIGRLVKLVIRLAIYAVVFAAFAWLLLDIGPAETWQRSVENLGNIGARISGAASTTVKTAGDMKDVAGYHLREAADRIEGKDPYEDFARSLDARIQQDLQ